MTSTPAHLIGGNADHLVDQRTWVTLLRRALENLGLPLPSAVADAEEAARTLAADLAFTPASAAEVADAVLAAKDPTTDRTVAKLLQRRALASSLLDPVAEQRGGTLVREALIASAAELMGAVAEAVAEVDEALHAAHEEFGDALDLDVLGPNVRHDLGVSRGGTAAAIYARALDARHRLEAIRDAHATILRLVGLPPTPPSAQLLHLLPGVDADDPNREVGPWKAVGRGAHLCYPTDPQAWRQRLADLDAERERVTALTEQTRTARIG